MEDCCQGNAFVEALRVPPAPDAGPAAPTAEVVLEVEGATCGACVARIESALRSVPGVREATFALATRRARVRHDAGLAEGALAEAIARAGYRAWDPASGANPARAPRRALWRAGLAGLAMMQVMMFAWPSYVAEGALDWDVQRLLDLASLAVTLPVLLFSATPIWTAAWREMRAGALGMDVTVALGIGAAFAASLPGTFMGGPVYYDAVTMFVFFLATGRYLESKALGAMVDASEALAQLLPRRAVRMLGNLREEVSPSALRPGDRVWIAAGDAAPADCVVVAGASDFNEAHLTGESAPARREPGDPLLAGSVNLAAPVEARVERCGADQSLAAAQRLVERAAADKPRWARLADRVASRFVLAILALAVAAAAYWLVADASRALPVVIAVLVVSCPCALSLATPAALTACANALARGGVLVTRSRAIETLASVRRIVFDKTGTLTTGRMRLVATDTFADVTARRCVEVAAALEQSMPHPLAHALVGAAGRVAARIEEVEVVPGAGVQARVDGVVYRVGSAAFCARLAGTPEPFATDDGAPLAALARAGAWLAVFRFDDTLRPEAAAAIARLRALGCEATLLSGDRAPVVDRVAQALGIDHAESMASPARKAEVLAGFAAAGEVAAMVGDGVNDAPGLARAPVAIAMGNGAALARSQADFVLLNPSLHAIADAIETARRTRRVIVQNLAWAAAYNAIALPLAMAGMLAPWMASLGMSVSSLLVVGNALRIARRQPRVDLRAPVAASS